MEEKDFKIADINADEAENEETSERTDSSADNSVMKQDKTRNHLNILSQLTAYLKKETENRLKPKMTSRLYQISLKKRNEEKPKKTKLQKALLSMLIS